MFWIYFRTALQREIATKVVKLDDVVRNTPLVLKLVDTYKSRAGEGGAPKVGCSSGVDISDMVRIKPLVLKLVDTYNR